MGVGKGKAVFAIIAALMMLGVAALPFVTVDEDVSGDSSKNTGYEVTTIDNLFDKIGSMDFDKDNFSSLDFDDLGDKFTDFIYYVR